jgi:hypothetical protein
MTTNQNPTATHYAAKAAHLTNMAAKAATPKIAEAYRLMSNRMADMALRACGQ